MKANKISLLVASVLFYLVLLLVLRSTAIQALPLFQSELPRPPENPFFITSFSGGRAYCGAPRSSVWLSVPSGFTSAGGAEFRCDPTAESLGRWPGGWGAWDDRGYLIGFWPNDIPIDRPLTLVFEIDPARAANGFFGRYYVANRGWVALPTTYHPNEGRVYVTISSFLDPSTYPGYADRFLVALFTGASAPPSSTATPTTTAEPSATSTRRSSTSTPAAEPASTMTPIPSPQPSLTPTAADATPEPTPSPTSTQRVETATPDFEVGDGELESPAREFGAVLTSGLGAVACLGFAVVLLGVVVIYLRVRSRR